MRDLLLIFAVVILSGCASNSGIISVGKDTYMVSRQAATGFSGSGTLKADAIEEAAEFCMERDKLLQIISTWEAEPPFIMANFPKAEVQFMCLDEGDRELVRPSLDQQANSILEVRKDVTVIVKDDGTQDMYSELLKLKDLLDKKIITQEEFNLQKAKLLAK